MLAIWLFEIFLAELAYTMEVNVKCDVYSLGVVTLEIVMGKHRVFRDIFSHLYHQDRHRQLHYQPIKCQSWMFYTNAYPLLPVNQYYILSGLA